MESKLALIGQKKRIVPQRFAFRICALFLIALCISTLLYSLFYSGYDLLSGYQHNEVDQKNWATRRMQVIRRCADRSKRSCFSVVDVIDEERNEAKRLLYTVGILDAETAVRLILPKGMSTKNSDTRLWAVNHDILLGHYTAAMIAAPFAIGALRLLSASLSEDSLSTSLIGSTTPLTHAAISLPSLKKEKKLEGNLECLVANETNAKAEESVLVIGMGGGALDMFLHRNFPNMNITVYELSALVSEFAHNWFGVKETCRRRTIIGDGMDAIQNASARGERFSALFIDACNSDVDVPCPDAKFLSASILAQMKSILEPTGTLVMNVLPQLNECENLKTIYRKLTGEFPTCVTVHFADEINTVFACLSYVVPDENLNVVSAMWLNAYGRVVRALRLDSALSGNASRFDALRPSNGEFQREHFGRALAC